MQDSKAAPKRNRKTNRIVVKKLFVGWNFVLYDCESKFSEFKLYFKPRL